MNHFYFLKRCDFEVELILRNKCVVLVLFNKNNDFSSDGRVRHHMKKVVLAIAQLLELAQLYVVMWVFVQQ